METSVILMVSEQTIPNVLFLKHFHKKFDKIYFFSTKEMEENNLSRSILDAYGHEIEYQIIILDANDFYASIKTFSTLKLSRKQTFLINATCGTKVMSLAVYSYFTTHYNSNIFYIPIRCNYFYEIFPLTETKENIPIKHNITIEDYFKAYAIQIKKHTLPLADKKTTLNMYHAYCKRELTDLMELLLYLRSVFNDKKLVLSRSDLSNIPHKKIKKKINELNLNYKETFETLFNFFEKIDSYFDGKIDNKSIDFITGGWFEDYCYHFLKELNFDDILLNVYIHHHQVDQELDIVIANNNKISVIECKTSLKSSKLSFHNETIYKLDSISKSFGLSVNKYIATLDDVVYKEHVENRSKEARIRVLGPQQLSPDRIQKTFSEEFFGK